MLIIIEHSHAEAEGKHSIPFLLFLLFTWTSAQMQNAVADGSGALFNFVIIYWTSTTTTYTSKIIVGKKFCKWNLYVFFCIFIAQYPPKFHLIQIYSSKVIGLHIYYCVCVCVIFARGYR